MKSYIVLFFPHGNNKKPEKRQFKEEGEEGIGHMEYTVMKKTRQLEFEVTSCIMSTVRKQSDK